MKFVRKNWGVLTDFACITVAVALRVGGWIDGDTVWQIMAAGAAFGHSDRLRSGSGDK